MAAIMIERHEAVALITINRPEAMNALDFAANDELIVGVPRSVATKITGHRTERVYRRYAILSDADLQEAARKLAAATPATGANSEIDQQR